MPKPRYNLLFSGDPAGDAASICEYIDEYYFSLDPAKSVEVNIAAVRGVVARMIQEFPVATGPDKASPFKKVGSFVCDFVAARPIETPLPNVDAQIAPHQNSVIAFQLAVDALEDATINCPKRGLLTIKNRIVVSTHFWKDLIVAMSRVDRMVHFSFVALLFESLVYQTNPEIAYAEKI